MKRGWAWVLGVALLAPAAPSARGADDDLSIVRKAVQADAGGGATAETKPPASRKGTTPQWLRVRIVEKGEKKAKVSINLPLSLVKAMGDDVPINWGHCRKWDGDEDAAKAKHKGCSLRLSEVLEALESGQDFVQIEDEDSTVRVYVE